jgi:hypothetical protein
MSITPSEAKRLGDTDADVLSERRRRSMLITPGEAERPGAVAVAVEVEIRQPYVPPIVTLHHVRIEESIADTVMYAQVNSWSKDEVVGNDADEGGDICVAWY